MKYLQFSSEKGSWWEPRRHTQSSNLKGIKADRHCQWHWHWHCSASGNFKFNLNLKFKLPVNLKLNLPLPLGPATGSGSELASWQLEVHWQFRLGVSGRFKLEAGAPGPGGPFKFAHWLCHTASGTASGTHAGCHQCSMALP